jgi:hypothetical protein
VGSLSPTFVPARHVRLAVKLPCAFARFWLISIQPEGTFGRLRYSLGGDRPSQTTHLTRFFRPLAGRKVEPRTAKSGISPSPPRAPQGTAHWVPPILRIPAPDSMPSCSKAPRGLFVLSRVTCIFTGPAISPSPLLRQCPSRYAFRAGRNLPDKEFRYLRTVIVTAAVYRGFSSSLISPPFNLPALGRRQPLYVRYARSSRDLCFW